MKFSNVKKENVPKFRNPAAEALYSELKMEGYPLMIPKKSYAEIVGCSVYSVDKYIKKGYGCPNFKKMGDKKNSRVLFSLIDIANYLSKTVEMV